MKNLICLLVLIFCPTLALALSTANVNADTVNVHATTVNIYPTQPLVDQYVHPWWINVGAGLTTGFDADDAVNAGYDLSANLQPTRHQLLTLRSSGAEFIGGDYYDIGLLYGFISRNPNGYISAAAGISSVFFEKNFLGKNDNAVVVGVPMELQAFWTPVSNFGLGFIGYANVNEKHSYYGAVLALQLANLVPF